MSQLSHNPHTYLSATISMMRNMFLVSSIGLATMAFSEAFKEYSKFIQYIALIIFIYSIIYGVKSARDFSQYIAYMETKKDLAKPYKFQIKQWKDWIYLTYSYAFILSIICIIIFMRKIKL